MITQDFFQFPPLATYSLDFFVPHSGVAHAYGLINEIYSSFLSGEKNFELIYLMGPKGVGKRHMANGFSERFSGLGVESQIFELAPADSGSKSGCATLYRDGKQLEESSVAAFASEYQRLKSEGGIIFVHSCALPDDRLISDPHVLSRLKSGQLLCLSFPQEEERYPLLRALLERHHIRLNDSKLKKIIELSPGTPGSFEVVSARIQELLQEGQKFNSALVRKVVDSAPQPPPVIPAKAGIQ